MLFSDTLLGDTRASWDVSRVHLYLVGRSWPQAYWAFHRQPGFCSYMRPSALLGIVVHSSGRRSNHKQVFDDEILL